MTDQLDDIKLTKRQILILRYLKAAYEEGDAQETFRSHTQIGSEIWGRYCSFTTFFVCLKLVEKGLVDRHPCGWYKLSAKGLKYVTDERITEWIKTERTPPIGW